MLLAAPQLVPTLVALREAGPGGAGVAGAVPSLAGAAGMVVRYASHAPAAVFALAAIPLVGRVAAIRGAAAVVALALLLLLLRGRPDEGGALPLAFDLALGLLGGLSLSAQWVARREPGEGACGSWPPSPRSSPRPPSRSRPP